MKIPFNFGGLPKKYSSYQSSKIAVLPIPFDGTSTWIKGTDKGPRALIEASGNMELYDIETDSEVYQKGIYTAPAIRANSTKVMIKKGCDATKKLLADDKFVVTLGGEHSISLGPIMAHTEKYSHISVLHLDAHSDRRDTYEGDKYNHACVMARAQEHAKTIVSAGIRSMDVSEKKNIARDTIYYAKNIVGSDKWMGEAVEKLTENVYITIDLDVFDPSIMLATGTPEPGGLSWYQVLKLMRQVAEKKNIVGFDVVELCPDPRNKAPNFLAAKLAYTMLSYIFKK